MMTLAEFENLKPGNIVMALATTDYYYTKGKCYIVIQKRDKWVLTKSDDKGSKGNGLRYNNFSVMPLLRKVK